MPGNWASDILVSWRHNTSGSTSANHSSTRGIRAFREFTFQVAINTAGNLRDPLISTGGDGPTPQR